VAIIVDENTKVLVQGITGSQGSFHTKRMLEYGTKIVAGVRPGKGGTEVHGVPVYDTVESAIRSTGANASVIFVPAPHAADAFMEAVDAGIEVVVVITEGIPAHDGLKMYHKAKSAGVKLIGPNTPGILSVERTHLGIMPTSVFSKRGIGRVGIVSRSGTLTYQVGQYLTKLGVGQSTVIGIGGDKIVGLGFVDVLKMFEEDEETDAIVLIGEIGGTQEEEAAEYIASHATKPVIAYIAGITAPPGKRMGHAGAIIEGGRGTAKSKIEALERAGALVGRTPLETAQLARKALSEGSR